MHHISSLHSCSFASAKRQRKIAQAKPLKLFFSRCGPDGHKKTSPLRVQHDAKFARRKRTSTSAWLSCNGPYASLAAMFSSRVRHLIVLSTVVAKDAISSFHVQSDPSTDSLSSISLLGWLKTCPEDLAKHAGAFLLMAARWALFFIFSVSQPGLFSLECLLEPGAWRSAAWLDDAACQGATK